MEESYVLKNGVVLGGIALFITAMFFDDLDFVVVLRYLALDFLSRFFFFSDALEAFFCPLWGSHAEHSEPYDAKPNK